MVLCTDPLGHSHNRHLSAIFTTLSYSLLSVVESPLSNSKNHHGKSNHA
jgi:hypothetical protein